MHKKLTLALLFSSPFIVLANNIGAGQQMPAPQLSTNSVEHIDLVNYGPDGQVISINHPVQQECTGDTNFCPICPHKFFNAFKEIVETSLGNIDKELENVIHRANLCELMFGGKPQQKQPILGGSLNCFVGKQTRDTLVTLWDKIKAEGEFTKNKILTTTADDETKQSLFSEIDTILQAYNAKFENLKKLTEVFDQSTKK